MEKVEEFQKKIKIGEPGYINKNCWLAKNLNYSPSKRCQYCKSKFLNCLFFRYLIISLILVFSLLTISFLIEGNISKSVIISIFVLIIAYGYFFDKSTEDIIEANFAQGKAKEALEELSENLQQKVDAQTKDIKQAYEIEKGARKLEKISREKAEDLTKELKKLEESKNQFIMATQHHLRTPLTAMRGYIDLLFGGIYGKIPPKIKEVLTKFNISTVNEIKVVNELLDISQFQLGKDVVLLQPNVDLEPILKEIVDEIKIEADKKGLYLKIERPKEFLPKAKADPMKLKVALFNVIDNAVKYTKKGGIILSLKTVDHTLRLTVKDTGAGIVKEEQANLFSHLFERGKTAQQFHATGRGIGLYLTYNIIRAHHGRMWVESEGKDKGSTFFIELPIGV